jgi:hypothetical protein
MLSLLRQHPAYAQLGNRHRFLAHLSAGCLGFRLAELTTIQAAAARAKRVLVVYETGGTSQMDTPESNPTAPIDHSRTVWVAVHASQRARPTVFRHPYRQPPFQRLEK